MLILLPRLRPLSRPTRLPSLRCGQQRWCGIDKSRNDPCRLTVRHGGNVLTLRSSVVTLTRRPELYPFCDTTFSYPHPNWNVICLTSQLSIITPFLPRLPGPSLFRSRPFGDDVPTSPQRRAHTQNTRTTRIFHASWDMSGDKWGQWLRGTVPKEESLTTKCCAPFLRHRVLCQTTASFRHGIVPWDYFFRVPSRRWVMAATDWDIPRWLHCPNNSRHCPRWSTS